MDRCTEPSRQRRTPLRAVLLAAVFTGLAGQTIGGAAGPDAPPVGFALTAQIAGAQTLRARTRWRNTEIKSQIAGRFFLTEADVAFITEAAARPAERTPAETPAQALAERCFRALVFTHENPSNYLNWRGQNPSQERRAFEGRFTAQRPPDGAATVTLAGALRQTESGMMQRRNGPNEWEAEWKAALEGTAELSPDRRAIARLVLTGKGTWSGEYFSQNEPMKDPWDAEFTIEITATPTPPELRSALARLAQELAHEEFARRNAATDQALQLDADTLNGFIGVLETCEDPELRHRGAILRARLAAPAP